LRRRNAVQHSDQSHRALLRAPSQGQRRGSADQWKKVSPPHSITPSAHRREATPIPRSESRTAKVRPVRVVGEGENRACTAGPERPVCGTPRLRLRVP
jgi:hypothetical protein